MMSSGAMRLLRATILKTQRWNAHHTIKYGMYLRGAPLHYTSWSPAAMKADNHMPFKISNVIAFPIIPTRPAWIGRDITIAVIAFLIITLAITRTFTRP